MSLPAQKQTVFSIDHYHERIRKEKAQPVFTDRMLSADDVAAKLKVSRSTFYRTAKGEGFPKPKRFSKTIVRWLESEIDDWIGSR
jgi:predicted DNA-binding transcriptional regulator AlpA